MKTHNLTNALKNKTQKPNKFVKTMSNVGYTYNGALTQKSTGQKNLDFFAISGSFGEHTSEETILNSFKEAYKESKILAIKNLFHLRDIHEGKGRRRAFRVIWDKFLNKDLRKALAPYLPDYGRYDDLVESNIDYVAYLIKKHMNGGEVKNAGLFFKWCPRNGSKLTELCKILKMGKGELRRYIVSNSDTIEQKICKNEFGQIDYSKLPSIAGFKYSELFRRKDEERYTKFLEEAKKNKELLKATNLTPADIYVKWERGILDNETIELFWKNLENVVGKSTKNFIPVCDVSGSMEGIPMNNSISLGVYLAENNNSPFKDFVVTFSEKPKFLYLDPAMSLAEKFELVSEDVGYNTDLQKTFDVILKKAVDEKMKNEDMPEYVIIFSDMEFDNPSINGTETNFEAIKRKYQEAGFNCPRLVFWNLNGREGNLQANFDENGVYQISGFSPKVISMLMKGEFKNSLNLMLEILNSERYAFVKRVFDRLANKGKPTKKPFNKNGKFKKPNNGKKLNNGFKKTFNKNGWNNCLNNGYKKPYNKNNNFNKNSQNLGDWKNKYKNFSINQTENIKFNKKWS